MVDSSVHSNPKFAENEFSEAKSADWWRDAVVYQIYPRSFADANGDGEGDLAGVIGKLDYLSRLGVDAIWLSPFYPSPLADGGYDVADYRAVDPRFGTMAQFDELVTRSHELGIKVIIDIVPNHTSDQHEWFRKALSAAPESPERARYVFHRGKGERGEIPDQLAEQLRRFRMGAVRRRLVLPAYVRQGAARSQLGQSGSARGIP